MFIKDTMANSKNYVDLGKRCGKVVEVLYRRLKGKRLDELTQALIYAIQDLIGLAKPAMRALYH
jgi:hypothetical protein